MESTLKISGLDFAAGKGHRLEDLFMPECGLLIWFFRGGATIGCIPLIRVTVPFSHK